MSDDESIEYWESRKEIERLYDTERGRHISISYLGLALSVIPAIGVYFLLRFLGLSENSSIIAASATALLLLVRWGIHILLCIESAIVWLKDDINAHYKTQHPTQAYLNKCWSKYKNEDGNGV